MNKENYWAGLLIVMVVLFCPSINTTWAQPTSPHLLAQQMSVEQQEKATATFASTPYTEDNPLIYEDAWDLWPYSFLDDEGNPAGFNIDLVKQLLHRLKIPFEIRLKHSKNAYRDLKEGRSDLILGMHADFHDEYGHYSNSVVCLFTHSVVNLKSSKTKIGKFKDLAHYRLIVHENSFSHHAMMNADIDHNIIPYDDMKEAVFHANTNDSISVLWNTMSLKWLLNKYHLTNLKLTPVNMQHGEYRFISNDTILLAKLDSVFNEMTINDELQAMRNKWFYPEYRDTGIPMYTWQVLIALAAVLLGVIIITVIYQYRERRTKRLLNNQHKRLMLYLKSGRISLWTFEIKSSNFSTVEMEDGKSEDKKFNALGLPITYDVEDFKRIGQSIEDIKAGKKKTDTLVVKSLPQEKGQQPKYFILDISVLRWEKGQPAILLGSQRDVTKEQSKQQSDREQLLKYYTVFNSSMADMAYFDRNGILLNINEKAAKTFGIKDVEELCNKKLHINDITPLMGIDYQQKEVVWSSSISNLDKLREEGEEIYINRTGILYYQSVLIPICDKEGEIDCIYCVGYDITEMVNTIKEEKEQAKNIEEVNKSLKSYVDSISYVLEESDISVVNYDPEKKMLSITKDMNAPQQHLSQLQCLKMTNRREWTKVVQTLQKMDCKEPMAINMTLRTIFKTDGLPQYLLFNAIPIVNEKEEDGDVIRYFGLCRDCSKMVETQRLLQMETEKAQEAETIKNAFLKNMSHEIRTPLNAVIGFAELFDSEHAVEDEPIFVNEIKQNTDILLTLINDILLLSRLDAKMIEFKPVPTNIATLFEAQCQMGWSRYINNDVKTNIHTDDKQLMVMVDAEHLSHVIKHIASNAAQFTEQGCINAKLTYHGGSIIINIEDTGVGIERESLKHIFDRFGQDANGQRLGKGLGLHICKEMVEQMGGNIHITSERGRGTSVWVSLPCQECKTTTTANDIITPEI